MTIRPQLSILVAAHREGLIAHKTMRSILAATSRLVEGDFEIIVTIDNGDATTWDYFTRYKSNSSISIHKISFGDLAHARNYAVEQAKGAYVATIDADDLVTPNWFQDGLALLKQATENVVLHTQYSVNFGTQDIIWEKFNSSTMGTDAVNMVQANRWDSAIITSKQILKDFPYEPNGNGYGSEDWHFNSQTLAAGIPHHIVPQTALFVRRKDVSLMTEQTLNRSTLRYTNLLDFDYLKTLPYVVVPKDSAIERMVHTLRKKTFTFLKRAHHAGKTIAPYRHVSTRALTALRKYRSRNQPERFPSWLIEEWRNIHEIENQLFPSQQLLRSIELYRSEMFEVGSVFVEIARQANGPLDYIIFVPTLSKGGSELLALRYIEAVHKQHPTWRVAVVTTESGKNDWRERVPADVRFIDFGALTAGYPQRLRLQLLARLVVQSRAHSIHIAQSRLAYIFVKHYKNLLQPLHVYCFAFCEDKNKEGETVGHIHAFLPDVYDVMDCIFTDNRHVIEDLVNEYAYEPSHFRVHYQPALYSIKKLAPKTTHHHTRILWASRIAHQKRPDIAVEIGRRLPDGYTLEMYGSLEDGYSSSLFNTTKVLYKGGFDGLNSIDTSEYSAFLYTSENDGIPNVLLEVTALGLPVVASNAGGIREFINNSTGRLVADIDDVQSYVEALVEICSSPELQESLVTTAQKLLRSQHSPAAFTQCVKRDIEPIE